jgi:hypothetical protein
MPSSSNLQVLMKALTVIFDVMASRTEDLERAREIESVEARVKREEYFDGWVRPVSGINYRTHRDEQSRNWMIAGMWNCDEALKVCGLM